MDYESVHEEDIQNDADPLVVECWIRISLENQYGSETLI
jgi:hypothetical protein